MGQQTPHRKHRLQTPRRVRPRHTRTDIGPEPGLRVAAVMAHPDLQARRERAPALRSDCHKVAGSSSRRLERNRYRPSRRRTVRSLSRRREKVKVSGVTGCFGSGIWMSTR